MSPRKLGEGPFTHRGLIRCSNSFTSCDRASQIFLPETTIYLYLSTYILIKPKADSNCGLLFSFLLLSPFKASCKQAAWKGKCFGGSGNSSKNGHGHM